jgi:hypothetical protein
MEIYTKKKKRKGKGEYASVKEISELKALTVWKDVK